MPLVESKDGTKIAFESAGEGPPVVLVSGASCARGVHTELAALLARSFTVVNYDRRGRGESGDTLPYAVEREIEDLEAVVAAAGGSAMVFGNSSGAGLALRAAAAGLPVTKLALWEPPFMTGEDAPRRHSEYLAQLNDLLAEGRRGDAMALFMRAIGVPEPAIAGMRQAPTWAGLEEIAPTLVYDALVMGDSLLPVDVVGRVEAPALVLDGSESGEWAAASARALEEALPHPTRYTFQGQNHAIAWDVLAPVLEKFFAARYRLDESPEGSRGF